MFAARRCFAIGASLLLTASSLPAQIAWGPTIGMNLAKLVGSDVYDQKMRMGFAAGAQFDKMGTEPGLFWRAGVNYSMQGSKREEAGPPATENSIKLAYINIPVLAGIKLPPITPNSPYLVVGPQAGLKLGCDLETKSGGASTSASCYDVGLRFKGFDLGGVLGLGASFAVGASALHVAATYTLSLITIDDEARPDEVRNRVFALTFSYMMPGQRVVNTGR